MEQIKVLDHGYVDLIEAWGTGRDGVDKGLHIDYPSDFEAGIIEAARMSTGKGFEGWDRDERLLSYLYSHKHMTPFEMAGMTIEVAAPIFVFREWHRHRTQSYNEMSGRYIPLPNENYVPDFDNVMERIQEGLYAKNKQATIQRRNVLIYLASPYSHSDPFVREERYMRAMRVLAEMLAKHQWAFSPIVHCHELKKIVSLPFEHEFWLDYDCHVLKRCEKLVVLRLEGWEESRGIKMEIAFSEANGIPVEYL